MVKRRKEDMLSAATFLEAVKNEIVDTEISNLAEARDILRVLAFKFGHLHTDHYYRVGRRADVVHHRGLFAPLLRSVLKSPRVWLIEADASFAHENAHSDNGWFSLDEEEDDLMPARTGTGRRLNMCEFVTEEGLLWHPDGASFSSPLCSPLMLN